MVARSSHVLHHVVWDWNGTLLDDTELCLDIANAFLKERSLAVLSREEYREVFGFPVKDYYTGLGFDFSRESYELLADRFIREYEQRRGDCALQPGALSALEAVRERGLTQSILSAYPQKLLEEIISKHSLGPYFNFLTGPGDHYAAGKLEP
ncbi:MAG: HAD family hydrolase [Planctomycetes bacterium]|nr:HAD family hydrolase [Planctomycetota bacterium]